MLARDGAVEGIAGDGAASELGRASLNGFGAQELSRTLSMHRLRHGVLEVGIREGSRKLRRLATDRLGAKASRHVREEPWLVQASNKAEPEHGEHRLRFQVCRQDQRSSPALKRGWRRL